MEIYNYMYSEKPVFVVGDLNNDGIDEMIIIEATSSAQTSGKIIYTLKNDLSKEYLTATDMIVPETLNFSGKIGNHYPEIKNIFIADINGDGLNDIMIITKEGSIFLKNKGGIKDADGIVRVSFMEMPPVSPIKLSEGHQRIKMGDFNGDGMIDFIRYDGQDYFTIHLNQGNFTFSSQSIAAEMQLHEDSFDGARDNDRNDNRDDFVVFDYNKDGKSDIIVYDAWYHKQCSWYLIGCMNPWMEYDHTKIKWFSSNGDGTFSLTENKTINATQNRPEEGYHFQGYCTTGDFDGDGREDLFSYKVDLIGHSCFPADHYVMKNVRFVGLTKTENNELQETTVINQLLFRIIGTCAWEYVAQNRNFINSCYFLSCFLCLSFS